MARKFVIVPTAELTEQMVLDTITTSMDTVRKNNDNTKAILKYEGTKPASISSYAIKTLEQIHTEIAKEEWRLSL